MSLFQTSPKSPRKPSAFAGPGVLCVLVMLVHFGISGGRVAVSLTALSLGRSTFEVGILIAVFATLPMLSSVKAGRIIDRIGPFKPMRAAAILTTCGALIPAIWQDLAALIIAAVCIGLGHMTFQIAVQGQMGQGTDEEKMRNFSWLSLCLATSGFFAPLLAGISIDHLGYRYAFALLALGPLSAVFGVLRMRSHLLAAHAKAPRHEGKKRSVRDLLAMKSLQRVFTANMLLSGAWDTHMFVVPIFGVGIGLSATTIGVIISCFALATVVIRAFLPIIQRHIRPWQLIHVAMALATLNFMVYPFFSEVWILMTLSFLLGLALGSTQPSMLALLQQHAPAGRAAEAFGVRMSLINASQVSLPLAFGALGTFMGIMPLFWLTGASLAFGRWFTRNAGSEPPPHNIEAPTS